MNHRRPRTARAALVIAIAVLAQASLIGFASAQLAPPPTPVPPDGSLSPFPQALDTPADASSSPVLSAPSAILADLDTGQVLFSRDADSERPIASLTKIMTALLVLERSKPTDIVTVEPDAVIAESDRPGISALGLETGERITVEDLFYALLLQSANDAAVALADHVSGSEGRFVKRMNARAATLSMRRTSFRSPNGLDDRGYSTARDLATLTRTAMATKGFASVVDTEFHTIPAPGGGERNIQNRDALLWLYPGATGVKTGYTSKAGYCVVATAERDGRRLVAVVLGAPRDAFSDAASLMDYGFAAFTQHTFVTQGLPSGVVTLPGGSVPVEAGGDLAALVPSASLDAILTEVQVVAGVAYPPAPGERVATLKITIPGLTVGRVPLVVSFVPPPPSIDERPWWERAAGAVFHAVETAARAVGA
ncbi:MAG: D-alanyl-D-alanine carboxypeptidase family protein [Actinomycetota bacterium]